ncbi:MAG: lysine exporter LysO family protein [Hornefia sp.]|nr:lysine exporter LysO family protein [Hornefia sp.]
MIRNREEREEIIVMGDLILYLGITFIGYIIGDKVKKRGIQLAWTGKIQTFAISALVFAMGVRIGCNDDVVSKLDSIGLYAVIFTFVVMLFSIFSITIARKMLGINRYGLRGEDTEEYTSKKSMEAGENKGSGNFKPDPMTVLIVFFVALGIAAGYFVIGKYMPNLDIFNEFLGLAIKIGLCTLLVFVGMDIGIEGKVIAQFKSVGIRILAIPAAIVAGTFIGAAVCSIILPISLKESLAIGAGFGWYSLAPGIIMDKGLVIAGAISFMHNVMREIFAIVLIPMVAHHIGYVETVGMPGAAAMDVCLPIVERSTSSATAIYSFVSGVFLSIAVPILVPFILNVF